MVLICGLFVFATGVAQIPSPNKNWYINAQLGYGQGIKLQNVHTIGEKTILPNQGADYSKATYLGHFAGSGYQIGIAIGKKITSVIGFELGLKYLSSHKIFKLKIHDAVNFRSYTETTSYRGFLLTASPSLVLRQIIKKTIFYISMGISIGGGELYKKFDDQQYVTSHYYPKQKYVFGWNYGLGIERKVKEHWSVCVDMRLDNVFYHYSHNSGIINPHPRKPYISQIPFSNLALKLGLMYHF